MLCLNRSMKTGFGFSFLVLFSVFFFSIFLGTDTYALEYSVNITGNLIGICNNTNPSSSISGFACSDFTYMYFYSNSDTSSVSESIYLSFGSYNRISVDMFPVLTSIYPGNLSVFTNNFSYLPSGIDIFLVLTTENPFEDCDCPEPPPVEPCPEIPENPYDSKFDEVTRAIYTCGAILLVLYFFYCIYRMILKSTGGF